MNKTTYGISFGSALAIVIGSAPALLVELRSHRSEI